MEEKKAIESPTANAFYNQTLHSCHAETAMLE
jgi:hypothetical protein